MALLFVLSGADVGRTIEFEPPVDLGRAAECDICLRAASVSRRHARIEPEGDGWMLVDLGSSNGTSVDGERIERVPLRDGAVFRLGDLELRFRTGIELEPESPADEPPGAESGPEPEQEEITLEGDWELVAPDVASPASPASDGGAARAAREPAPATPARRRVPGRAERAAGPGARSAAPVRGTASGGRVLQYQRVPDRGGLFGADLSQYGPWVRWLAYLGALCSLLFAGLAYGAFKLTTTLRSQQSALTSESE